MPPQEHESGWIDRLRRHGDRITPSRRAVVMALASSDRALSALEILEWARPWCPGLGIVTVYRTIERLQHLGLVQRVHGVNSCHSYIAVSDARRFMFLCERCGSADALSMPDMETMVGQAATALGFQVQALTFQVNGLCRRCQSEPATPMAEATAVADVTVC